MNVIFGASGMVSSCLSQAVSLKPTENEVKGLEI